MDDGLHLPGGAHEEEDPHHEAGHLRGTAAHRRTLPAPEEVRGSRAQLRGAHLVATCNARI